MVGIIIANTGSPAAPEPDAIEAYLRAFLMDDRIRQLPKPLWKWLLNKHILPKRKFSAAKRYEFIWTAEGSPLIAGQERLAQKVQRLFDEDPSASKEPISVRSAMSYGEPSILHALEELKGAGADEVVLLPLYPQSAYSPTLAVVDAFDRALAALAWHPRRTVIDNYHDDAGYIAAFADAVRSVGFGAQPEDRLFLSFHAIPLKDEKAGDTYRAQIVRTTELIAQELGVSLSTISVAYQSVFGHDPSKWTAPLARDVLAGWRDKDFRVFFACPGFAIDCLETICDVPFEMVPALEGEHAVPTANHADADVQRTCNTDGRFVWVPTLGDSDAHAAVVKSIIARNLK